MIPIVDQGSSSFAEDLIEACESVGFVSITGHGIDIAQFAQMRSLLKRLFDLDEQVKAAAMIAPDNYRGFIPLGFFTPNRGEANGIAGDQYEGYKLHWECPSNHDVARECSLYGRNRWVAEIPGMKQTVLTYMAACAKVADQLLPVFADYLGISRELFLKWHAAPLSNMTLLHYPAQPPTSANTGIHAHKDTNVITFLHPDPVGGLDVRQADGSWVQATPSSEALLVNIGEMLELWSGGRLVATPHRVTNTSGMERYSFPYFVVPNHRIVVEPLLPCRPGFEPSTMPVGELSAEVWRTNWPNEQPSDAGFDLGTLDR